MSATISTMIDIDASPQAVWDVLTNFAAYGEWNPFMSRTEGTPTVGTKLVVRMSAPGGRGMTLKQRVENARLPR